MNSDNLFDSADFVSVHTNEVAKICLAFETTTVSSLMNLSDTVGHADRVDPRVFHDQK